MKKDLYLMRHGQTLFNEQKRVQGACDSPLTQAGREQAARAGRFFVEHGVEFGALFLSTQERASDTLELVTGRTDYERVKGLKEWNFGLFEGQPEFLQPQRRPGALSFEDLHVPYGGESADQVGQRMKSALTEIMERAESPVLALSHGGAIWAFMLALGVTERPAGATFGNCMICHYVVEDGKFDLVEMIDPLAENGEVVHKQ